MKTDTQHGTIRLIGKKFIKPEPTVTLVVKDCLVTSSEEFTLPDRTKREGIFLHVDFDKKWHREGRLQCVIFYDALAEDQHARATQYGDIVSLAGRLATEEELLSLRLVTFIDNRFPVVLVESIQERAPYPRQQYQH
jgi:hypothetical protein